MSIVQAENSTDCHTYTSPTFYCITMHLFSLSITKIHTCRTASYLALRRIWHDTGTNSIMWFRISTTVQAVLIILVINQSLVTDAHNPTNRFWPSSLHDVHWIVLVPARASTPQICTSEALHPLNSTNVGWSRHVTCMHSEWVPIDHDFWSWSAKTSSCRRWCNFIFYWLARLVIKHLWLCEIR